MFDLSGKVALVTGASGGIGGAIAEALHAQGAAVALSGRRADALEALAARLGEGAHALPCDLADREALAALPERAAEAAGAPAILVHCGGITRDGSRAPHEGRGLAGGPRRSTSAPASCSPAPCLRGMIRQRWGRLIVITSVVGTTGNAGQANYAASKAGLAGMVKALAAEAAARGVTANCVAPRLHRDGNDRRAGRRPRRRPCWARSPPGVSARRATWPPPASTSRAREARYVTGQTLHVNGGMAMI